jgi:hypothetical protein
MVEMRATRKPRRRLFVAAALVFGLLLGCGIAELILRVMGREPWRTIVARENEPVMHGPDPQLGWKPIPGRHTVAPYAPGGPTVHLTFLGDGARTTGTTPAQGDKLVFVGGSTTQGWAVSDEETFPWLIQQQFPAFAVYNYGVSAYGTYQSLLVLEQLFAAPNPPRFVFYGLDEEHEPRNVADSKWLLPLALLSKGGIIETPYVTLDQNGGLIRHAPEGYPRWPGREYSALITQIQHNYANVSGRIRAPQARAVTERLLVEMRDLVERHGSRFAVILFHLPPPAREHYVAFLSRHGVDFVDCSFPITAEYRVRGDHHANGAMHVRYADCITAKMRAAGWIAP